MREAELDMADQLMIRHQFSQVPLTSTEWLRLAASVLAGNARAASVVTPARSRRARFGHVQLVALADGARLVVLVLADGNVHQRRLDRNRLERELPDEPLDQPALDAAAGALNGDMAGLTGSQVGSEPAGSAARGPHRCGGGGDARGRGLGRGGGGLHRRHRSRARSAGVRGGRSCARSSRSCSGPTSSSSSSRC